MFVCVVLCDTDSEAYRRTIAEIWTTDKTNQKVTVVNEPRLTAKDIVPGDADLADSEDEDSQSQAGDGRAIDGRAVLWDDPDFSTPSSISVIVKTFTGIEWMRPPVSIH